MSLDGNAESSKAEFVAAMRSRLEQLTPPEVQETSLEAIDDPEGDVQKNLGALGLAVFTILTERAETISDSTTDEDFWAWIEAINAWLLNLSTWQQGIVNAVNNWTPVQPSEQAFKAALIALSNPGPPPQLPPEQRDLKGRIK